MSTGVTYTIGGVKVEFPVKAYPSQISMMDKIIRGCSKAQNCLLESPTGSGKTLALLCGALAWQKAEKERLDKTYAAEMSEYLRLKMELEKQNKQNPEAVSPTTCKDEEKCCDSDESEVVVLGVDDVNEAEDGDVFRPVVKRIKMELNKVTDKIKNKLVNAAEIIQKTVGSESNENSESNLKNETVQNPEPKRSKAPKIYFCTRTHKQLAQVVNELRRTAFKNVKNTVLSSRTHSCIQDSRYDEKINKTELCRQLLDPRTGMSCRFHKNVRNYPTFDALECAGFSTPWDLEDLVQFGRKKTVCPYFVARELMTQSDIIFCPYNYLIDPLIRNSMKINLKGDIIIVDEAHNIEDSCREAASFTVMQDSIQASIQECEEILKTLEEENAKRGPCQEIINTLCALSSWIDKHKNEISQMSDYNQGKFDMYGSKAVDSFKDYKFGPSNFAAFAENYALLTTEEKKSTEELIMEDEVSTTITGPTKALLEGFLLILSLLYNPTYTHDYRVVLIKTFNQNYDQQPEQEEDGWFSRKKPRKIISRWNHGLHFWCFNPAASFCRIKENARCVVLSSGTLSPTSSFQSELGALFPITLEANHVIEANQCWVGSLGVGPNNVLLDGKYASTNTYQFQDELGKILLHICSFVPHGVLCFVPSYFLLEKLYERWSCTGTLDAISEHKTVMCEPRRGDQLDNLLKEFYDTIECTAENIVGQGVTGVLLLAVCRGKVSEGMDFADKNARVVITVGIPYPSIKDDQILMKRSYNDSHKDSKGLLSGQAWYEIQAYRALNQALGRCIRHRRDWGAILLIDNRFKNDHYYKSLSKWVRSKVFHCDNYSSMIDSLSTFIENRLKLEKESELLS